MTATRVIRWKAAAPLTLCLGLMVAGWMLLADRLLTRAIEATGAAVVGAKVDVGSAHIDLWHGQVTLRDIAVTDPGAPMTNLVEMANVVAALRPLPLLEKKVVLDTMAVREVRFGTPRRTSGAIPREPSAFSAMLRQQVNAWAGQVRLPSLSLEGLGGVVNVGAISADSLRTVLLARQLTARADSSRQAWEARLVGLNPDPIADSARDLADRLKGADVRTLGVAGVRDAATSVRAMLASVDRTKTGVTALERDVRSGVTDLAGGVGGLEQAKAQDLAYALGLLKLPSLNAPDISPAIFGDMAIKRLQSVLYWLAVVDHYLPPGLDPRRSSGPKRMRRAGTTVRWPRAHENPAFVLEYAEASLTVGGAGAAAGQYLARAVGFTSAPALYGRPAKFLVQRTGAAAGPRDLRVVGLLDHVRQPVKDSIDAAVSGVGLPSLTLPALGADLTLGAGTTHISVLRAGDSLAARWLVRSDSVRWTRTDGGSPATDAPVGSKAWADALLWRTVSGLHAVEIEARLSGSLSRPRLGVGSNLGPALAQSLKREVGAEVAKAEARVRGRVDSLVQTQVADAQAKLETVRSGVATKVTEQRARLEQVQADLDARLKALVPSVRLPGR